MNYFIEAECLRRFKDLVNKYNKLFDTNSNLIKQNKQLQVNSALSRNRQYCDYSKRIQILIEREKCHINLIKKLKYELCTKDNDINRLKLNEELNEKQINEYQNELKLIREKYQKELCKIVNTCKCCSSIDYESERSTVDSKSSFEDKLAVDLKCSSENKLSVDSKCSCENKLSVDSKCSCENKLSVDSKCSCENKLLVDSKCSCENKLSGDSTCSCEDKLPVDSKLSCEDNSVENVSEDKIYSDVQQLLLAIDEYCNSKTLCISILSLLKQSKTAISSLIEENYISSNALKQCQSDFACSTNTLNEQLEMLKKKDSEIFTMRSDFTILVDELKQIVNEKSNLENRLSQVTEELYSTTENHEQLLNKFEEQKEELNNMKSCSKVNLCADECISKEICEKTQTLSNDIKIIDGLENKLCDMKLQLKETVNLKTICDNQCKNLCIQNVELKNELEIEKNKNRKNIYNVDNLCKRILKFEAVIKGFEVQNKLYIVEIAELKENKCIAEKKYNEIINELNLTIEQLRKELVTTKLKAEKYEQFLKNLSDEDKKYYEQQIKSLNNNIENLKTELKYYKTQYDSLMTKNLLNEKELSQFIEKIQLLQTREFELNKENEENKERVSMLCTTVDALKRELEDTIQKNHVLICQNRNLEATNVVHCEDIDKLNNTLVCVRKNESCVRKNLVVYKEKLAKADEEIENLNSEINHVQNKLDTTCVNLSCTEQKLQDTELKLNEEICLKEKINDKYYNMVNCLTTNCNMEQSIKPTSLKSTECQYEIGDYCCFNDENNASCNATNDDVQALHYENNFSIIDCKMTKESTHIGLQTNLCCPDICPPISKTVSVIIEQSCPNDNILCCPEPCNVNKCDFGQCESNISCTCLCESPLKTGSQTHCHSDDCLRPEESKLTTTCDCIAGFLEKENLKCQLDESEKLLKQYEQKAKDAELKLCAIEEERCKKELNMNKCFDKEKSEYQTNLDEVTDQLRSCNETIACKENDLKCCRSRENQLKKDIEKLKETLKCKDKKIKDYENKMNSLNDSLDECKKQFVTLKCSLELEKATKLELDKQLETFDDQSEKKIVKKLKTPEKVAVKKRRKSGSVRKNKSKISLKEKKKVMTPCERQRMRSGADHETVHGFSGTKLEMNSRRHYNGYKDDSHNYPNVCENSRGISKGDLATHTLPAEFIESLRQQVRQNVVCENTKCSTMGCCYDRTRR